ncbi:MAG: hypothetical protein EOP84_17555 [Verrucomicrobiaceae bacterium]|nr:MAG: hypothetical protein EOP84_17555 [Verrucomicrobiaceae bacterium]
MDGQRETMYRLFMALGGDKESTIRAYAEAEERGEVERKSNTHAWGSLTYARALWRDGVRNGWLPVMTD